MTYTKLYAVYIGGRLAYIGITHDTLRDRVMLHLSRRVFVRATMRAKVLRVFEDEQAARDWEGWIIRKAHAHELCWLNQTARKVVFPRSSYSPFSGLDLAQEKESFWPTRMGGYRRASLMNACLADVNTH